MAGLKVTSALFEATITRVEGRVAVEVRRQPFCGDRWPRVLYQTSFRHTESAKAYVRGVVRGFREAEQRGRVLWNAA